MISWIVIGMLIILALVLAKLKHIRHKTFLIIIVILVIFFYFTATKVIGNQNLDLGSFDGIVKAGRIYFSWLVHIGSNIKNLAGEAVKMEWIDNSTIQAEK